MADAPLSVVRSVPGVPAGGDHVSLGTVAGVPLEDGERVVFFVAPNHRTTKILLVLLGIVLSVLVFGLFVIVYGVLYDRWGLRFVAVTNHRLLVQKGDGPARFMRLDDVVDVRARRFERSAAGGGLIGAVISNTASLALPGEQAKKTSIDYWESADAVVVEGTKGTFVIDKSADPKRLGPVIANALYTDGFFDRTPTIHSPP